MTSAAIDLTGDARRQRKERAIGSGFALAAASSVLISGLIIFSLFGKAIEFITNVPISSLWSDGWYPRRGLYDIRTLFVGTAIVTGTGMLVAAPLGLGAAVFLSEYASPRVRGVVKPVLEILASLPSIVIAFFAYTWVNPNIVQALNPAAENFNLAAAGLGVGILMTPLVASVSEDALSAVPATLREAAYGMGSRKVTASLRVVVPAAVSGIVASLILAVSRGIGETMVVLLVAGGSGGTLLGFDPFSVGATMPGAMASLATGSDQVRGNGQAFNSLYFLGLLLFFVTLSLNMLGNRFVRRFRNQY